MLNKVVKMFINQYWVLKEKLLYFITDVRDVSLTLQFCYLIEYIHKNILDDIMGMPLNSNWLLYIGLTTSPLSAQLHIINMVTQYYTVIAT